jgi:hypothetical protein
LDIGQTSAQCSKEDQSGRFRNSKSVSRHGTLDKDRLDALLTGLEGLEVRENFLHKPRSRINVIEHQIQMRASEMKGGLYVVVVAGSVHGFQISFLVINSASNGPIIIILFFPVFCRKAFLLAAEFCVGIENLSLTQS